MSDDNLTKEINNIRDKYFYGPTEPVKPEELTVRQDIHYLLGVVDALMRDKP